MTATVSPDATATVLVAEDDPGIAELERGRLEEVGYRVVLVRRPSPTTPCERSAGWRSGPGVARLPSARWGGRCLNSTLGLKWPGVRPAGHPGDRLPATTPPSSGRCAAGVRDYIFKSVEYLDYLPEAVRRVLDAR